MATTADGTNGPSREASKRRLQILRRAFESVPEAVFLVRPDGREIVACNPAAGRLFGYRCGELLGKSTEVLHVDRERFEAFGRLSEGALERREMYRVDWEMQRADGSVFPTTHTVSLIDENLGLGGGVVSIVRDRSGMDYAASALRELEGRYQVLFEDSPEAMCVYALDTGQMIAVNRALAELYGGEPADLVDRPIEDLVIDEDQAAIRELLGEPRPEDRRVRRWHARRHDGAIRVLHTTSSAITFDGLRARLVVLSDVTERIQAESLARRLLAILDATPDFVAIADRTEQVEYVNPSGLRLLGLEGLEVTGTTLRDYVPAETQRILDEEVLPVIREKGVWTGEAHLRHRDGTTIPVSQVIIHHADREAGITYLSTIARDMREHQRLEEQLRQSQKMEAIGRLAGGIAHDFNNLLTALTGYADLALVEADDSEAVRQHVGEILSGARRAAALTGQLLAFSRRQTLATRVVDLDQIVTESETMLRRTLEENLDIRIRLSGGRARTEGDPARLHQVLLNLALNARDAMPGGGTLWIESDLVQLTEPRQTGGAALAAGEYAIIRVGDTGTGMDPDLASQIFEPFFTTKAPGEGTGLGLSTVYGIVTQSGGSVEVETEPGHGSAFTVYLPRASAPVEPPLETTPAEAEAPGITATVLLVEDDRSVRRFLRQALETGGHTVLVAACADEALELRTDFGGSVDLLVTDVVLPEMDGRQLTERLRDRDPELPVIFISGYSYETIGGHAPEEAAAFLQKPFSASELMAAVQRALGQQAARTPGQTGARGRRGSRGGRR